MEGWTGAVLDMGSSVVGGGAVSKVPGGPDTGLAPPSARSRSLGQSHPSKCIGTNQLSLSEDDGNLGVDDLVMLQDL